MTKEQMRISKLNNKDLLRETMHTIEINAYAFCRKGKLSLYEQSLENDLKFECCRRFVSEGDFL